MARQLTSTVSQVIDRPTLPTLSIKFVSKLQLHNDTILVTHSKNWGGRRFLNYGQLQQAGSEEEQLSNTETWWGARGHRQSTWPPRTLHRLSTWWQNNRNNQIERKQLKAESRAIAWGAIIFAWTAWSIPNTSNNRKLSLYKHRGMQHTQIHRIQGNRFWCKPYLHEWYDQFRTQAMTRNSLGTNSKMHNHPNS